MDICHDVKTFLERMCRTCSRFYGESEDITFYDLFQVKIRNKKGCRALPITGKDYNVVDDDDVEEDEEEEYDDDEDEDDDNVSFIYELNDQVKSIFEDFEIWKLNVS